MSFVASNLLRLESGRETNVRPFDSTLISSGDNLCGDRLIMFNGVCWDVFFVPF